jgi:PKD repeat protein
MRREITGIISALVLVSLVLVIAGPMAIPVQAASVTNNGTTAADDSSIGMVAWTSVNNSLTQNDQYASAGLTKNEVSHYLKVTNFGFVIPDGATIQGIVVGIDRYGGSGIGNGHQISDYSIRLVKGGTINGTDKSAAAIWPASDTDTYVSYGNSTDVWGLNWTPADINGSGFGAVVSAIKGNGNSARTAYVDHIQITVYYTLVATASSNSPVCEGATIQLYGGPNGMTSYNWTGPGGWTSSAQNATRSGATLAMAGNYTLTVTDSNNVTASNTTNVIVNATPTANFSANVPSGCAPLIVQFTDTSTGNPTGWSWNFGDGSNSTAQSPSHQYNNAGTYTVSLNVSNACGSNTTTKSNYITVYPLPDCTITAPAAVCALSTGNTASVPSAGVNATYNWSITGGTITAGNNTTQITWTAGAGASANISVTITNGNGCTCSSSQLVTINALPNATASSNSPVCEGATIELYGGPSGMASYNWTGPNGFSSSLQSPSIPNATLAMAGNYTLTVTNSNGCTASNTTSIFVQDCPTDYYTDWVSYCNGTSIWRTRDFHDYYCFNGTCQEDVIPESEFVQDCPTDYYTDWVSYCNGTSIWRTRDFHDYYCFNGTCQEDVIPESEFVQDCPADYYTDWVSYCNGTSIWRTRDFHDYYCFNGTCQEDVIPESEFVQDCPADYYTDWVSYCNGTSIWRTRDFHDYYCFNGTCQEDVIPESEWVESCDDGDPCTTDTCENGTCVHTPQDLDQDGYTVCQGDCNDNDNTVYPGAPELCDGKDNDCDTQVDEGVTNTYYGDADGDGYGNTSNSTQSCSQPQGYVSNNTDCDDSNASVHPGATEVCNGIDDNCNGQVDEGVTTTWYQDNDGDAYGNPAVSQQACSQPSGYVSDNTDCNDSNASVHPGATEVYNSIDDNCNGQIDEGYTYNISGIIRVGGTPLAGVLVTASSPWTGTAITDADGKYVLTGVPYGETNIHITPTLAGYTFNPPTITVPGPMTASADDQDFAAMLAAPCDVYILPSTYAKIPFAIVQSGFHMLGCLLGDLDTVLGGMISLPFALGDLAPVLNTLGDWAGGPLSWSVDMLAWGVDILNCIVGYIAGPLGLPSYITDIVKCISDGLRECYPASMTCNNVSNVYCPCP